MLVIMALRQGREQGYTIRKAESAFFSVTRPTLGLDALLPGDFSMQPLLEVVVGKVVATRSQMSSFWCSWFIIIDSGCLLLRGLYFGDRRNHCFLSLAQKKIKIVNSNRFGRF
jgi:hypothetical protein